MLKRKDVVLRIPIRAKASVSDEEIVATVMRLIDVGLGDATDTIESGEGNLDAAEMAHGLDIGSPVVSTPRVLVVVSGGVADIYQDEGADVEIFDWDNYKTDPEATDGVSINFADLAEPLDIPVNKPDMEGDFVFQGV